MTPRPEQVKRILVGVDGSGYSQRALAWAVLLAQGLGAEVVAVHAVGLLSRIGVGPPVPSQSHLDDVSRAFVTEWCAPLAGSGVAHRMLLVDGSPALALLAAAEEEDADVIVLGRRGVGGFAEVLLGSTSLHVAGSAGRPVVIVPPPDLADPPHPGQATGG